MSRHSKRFYESEKRIQVGDRHSHDCDSFRCWRRNLLLLERGADPNRVGADGMTFGRMLRDHRAQFQRTHKSPPVEFATLWDWADRHGIVQQTQ